MTVCETNQKLFKDLPLFFFGAIFDTATKLRLCRSLVSLKKNPTDSFVFKRCPQVWFAKACEGSIHSCFYFNLIAPSDQTERLNVDETVKGLHLGGGEKRRKGDRRRKKSGFCCSFSRKKMSDWRGSDTTQCCVSACRAEASCWSPVSLAKNKPGWRGEDSSPLSICIFPSFVSPSFFFPHFLPLRADDYTQLYWLSVLFSTAHYHWAETAT